MQFRDRSYLLAGIGLLVVGLALTPVAYFVLRAVPMTALGISLLILGGVFLSLDRAIPRLPPDMARLMLDAGMDNLGALIEELGLSGRAIYLPSSITGGIAQALVPLHSNPGLSTVPQALPRRLIVTYGRSPNETGILVTTPGTLALKLLHAHTTPAPQGLEEALGTVLIGGLDVATGVQVSSQEEGVEVVLSHPWREYQRSRASQVMGSALASVAACLASETWKRPVMIEGETFNGSKQIVKLKFCDHEALQ